MAGKTAQQAQVVDSISGVLSLVQEAEKACIYERLMIDMVCTPIPHSPNTLVLPSRRIRHCINTRFERPDVCSSVNLAGSNINLSHVKQPDYAMS